MRRVFVLSTFLACLAVATASAQDIQSIKLLTANTGWAASDQRLFWTDDNGGNWKDITPRTPNSPKIASVFFLDTSTGWVLLSHLTESDDLPIFDLASTTNAGKDWMVVRVKLPKLYPESTLAGGGDISFVDRNHGWMNLSVVSGAAAHTGVLAATSDAGKSWYWLPSTTSGEIEFVTAKDGWVVSPSKDEMYVTHDGAKTWSGLSLQTPSGFHGPAAASFSLPALADHTHGYMVVTFSGPEDPQYWLALYTTNDGGHDWREANVEPVTASSVTSAVTGSAWVTASIAKSSLRLQAVTPGSKAPTSIVSADLAEIGHRVAIWKASFVSAGQGWLLAQVLNPPGTGVQGRQLFATSNGGTSWVNVTPPHSTNPK